MAAAAAEAMETLQPAVKKFHERRQVHDALDKVGWLPHPTVPYRLVEGCGDDLALLDDRIADYYRSRWPEIRDEMESGLAEYHIDDDARATFREALIAHTRRRPSTSARSPASGNGYGGMEWNHEEHHGDRRIQGPSFSSIPTSPCFGASSSA